MERCEALGTVRELMIECHDDVEVMLSNWLYFRGQIENEA